MFNYKSIPDSCPFCYGVNLQVEGTYHPTPGNLGYSTHPLSQYSYWLLLYTCSDHGSTTNYGYHYHLHKSLKEHSLQQSTYSRFISGIKRLLINGGCCFFKFSTLNAMKHLFEFKHWLFVLVIIFHIFQLEGVWWQDFSPVMGKKAEVARRPSHCCFFPPPCTLDLSIRYVT